MLTYFNIETYIVKRTKDVMSDARFHLNLPDILKGLQKTDLM